MPTAPAALFNAASSEYLSVASNTTLQTGDIDFWVAGWFLRNGNPAGGAWYSLISKYDSGAMAEYDLYLLNSTADIAFATLDGLVGSPTSIPLGVWFFVLAWRDTVNNTVNVRVNNGAIGSFATGGPLQAATAAPLRIGADTNPPTGFLNGKAAAVAFGKSPVFGIADAAPLISSSLYNGGAGKLYSDLAPAEKTSWGLVSYWDLDEESAGAIPVYRLDSHGSNHLADNNTVASTTGIVQLPEAPPATATPFDPASLDSDIFYVDGLEYVAYIPRDLNGVEIAPISDLPAFREQIETEIDTGAEGWQVMDSGSKWHIYGPDMGSTIPKRGDRIISLASGTWEVTENLRPCLGRWYEASVRAVP